MKLIEKTKFFRDEEANVLERIIPIESGFTSLIKSKESDSN